MTYIQKLHNKMCFKTYSSMKKKKMGSLSVMAPIKISSPNWKETIKLQQWSMIFEIYMHFFPSYTQRFSAKK